ncbi:hypothetical protein CBOM_07598 [Ceraceosorus bombacis]|uniref:Uncharacterized protein n=1 Tax=Ceraceosorus bombacis TaxID=401625 RepID=A0A0P1BG42_9BASI|nr:hypothetical protein CBOM_07598 [Ceraceosorus bombacis]
MRKRRNAAFIPAWNPYRHEHMKIRSAVDVSREPGERDTVQQAPIASATCPTPRDKPAQSGRQGL